MSFWYTQMIREASMLVVMALAIYLRQRLTVLRRLVFDLRICMHPLQYAPLHGLDC